ncbi:MAG: 2-oxoacid:acceptor oxidoreductase subunit alpha [Gemmatimonadota bacterium]
MREPTVDRTNDFAFKIATVNGTGSASANGLIMQAIFRMGIPISGKNLFPSNIQGMPTWYEIRVNREGYTARTPRFDLMIAMNPATYARDIAEVCSGGWVVHDSSWPLGEDMGREDISFLGIPLGQMCVEQFTGSRERILMKNIAYVGALAALIDVDTDVVRTMMEEKFSRKPALVKSNYRALELGYDYAKDNFECPLPIRLEPMSATDDSIIIDGNMAAALGCVYAGATVGAWYPITPSTSLMDSFVQFCERFRVDPETGKKNFFIAQAEDELSAAGIIIGAGWAGARAFTPTSGPGISLMSEFIGFAYYAEIPTVFFNVQRTGPSTGMPTRTQQGDLLLTAYASHGDTKHIVLFPADPAECFSLSVAAFDLADRFQTPVFVLSDLDIGMNDWVSPRLEWDDAYRPDRGKVLGPAELENIENFYRYVDSDGDGIAARTLPGTHPKGSYFTRGSGHDQFGVYTEDGPQYQEVVDRIARKIQSSAMAAPAPLFDLQNESAAAPVGLVTVGGCDGAVREALALLRAEGQELDYMRIRAFPFAPAVSEFLESHEKCYVIEQNRDGQLRTMLALETGVPAERLVAILDYGGTPLSADTITRVLSRSPGDQPAGPPLVEVRS